MANRNAWICWPNLLPRDNGHLNHLKSFLPISWAARWVSQVAGEKATEHIVGRRVVMVFIIRLVES